MQSKMLVKDLIAKKCTTRFGVDFSDISDIYSIATAEKLIKRKYPMELYTYDYHEELSDKIGFAGQTKLDALNNIWGRLNGKGEGLPLSGALKDWEDKEEFFNIEFNNEIYASWENEINIHSDKYVVVKLPLNTFHDLRASRGYANALKDVIINKDLVKEYFTLVMQKNLEVLERFIEFNVDGVFINDDLATQVDTFFGEKEFEELLFPVYKEICEYAHANSKDVFIHSCGKTNRFIPYFVKAGIDVLQTNQPEVYPLSWLIDEYSSRLTLYMSVDIQKILPINNYAVIDEYINKMLNLCKVNNASVIFMEYKSYKNINISKEVVEHINQLLLSNITRY